MPFVNNHGVKIYFETVGRGKAIVFHHGFGNSIGDYYELGYVDALKDDYQLILIDGRGFGKSDKLYDPSNYAFDLRTADTISVMDALQVEKAIAWGNSMGGRMVYAFMQHYPERFLAYCAGGMHPYAESTAMASSIQAWLSQGMVHAVDSFEERYEPFPKNLRQRYLKNDPQAMLAVAKNIAPDFSGALSQITAPILLYSGSEDEVFLKIQEASKLIRQGEFKVFSGLNHCQAYWQGDVVSASIKDFLKTYRL